MQHASVLTLWVCMLCTGHVGGVEKGRKVIEPEVFNSGLLSK